MSDRQADSNGPVIVERSLILLWVALKQLMRGTARIVQPDQLCGFSYSRPVKCWNNSRAAFSIACSLGNVVKMSIERALRTLRLCRLTSRRRALTRAWRLDALLCNGTPGTDSTVSSSSFFAAVFAMRSSNALVTVHRVVSVF